MGNSFLPVIEKLKDAYKLWQQILPHISKSQRQTIGSKIDKLILDTLEKIYCANYVPTSQRLVLVLEAITKNDLAKFFLMVGWENKIIDDKKYIQLSEKLVESSKMLIGWKEYLRKLPQIVKVEERKK